MTRGERRKPSRRLEDRALDKLLKDTSRERRPATKAGRRYEKRMRAARRVERGGCAVTTLAGVAAALATALRARGWL